jgi:hypothetical protein
MRPNLSSVLWIALVLYFLLALAEIVRDGGADGTYGSDFSMYYYTTKAYDAGINPYDRQAVEAASRQSLFEFYYFPASLNVFRPFTWLPQNAARLIYLVLQCVLLIYLLFLWQRFFLQEPADPWFFLFCLLAFNGTIYLDFQSGNVSMIEQALLWTAFYSFLRNEPVRFSMLIVLASIFKVAPVFFVLLILVRKRNEQIGYMIRFGCVLSAGLAIAIATDARLVGHFFAHLPSILSLPSEQGIMNPSSLALFKSVSIVLTRTGWLEWPRLFQWTAYVCWVASIAVVSWRALQKLDTSQDDDMRWAINFMCLVFALVSLRFKDYSYIILILPTYFLLKRMTALRPYHLGFILCILSAQYVTLPGFRLLTTALWHYYPLALAFVVWIAYLIEFSARKRADETPSET